MSKQTTTESGPQSGLHGELKLAEARLLPARLRVMVAGMILAVTIPLEWAFGFDFFAEFGRDALGEIGGFDLAIAALKGLMLLSAVVILKYALQALSADARKKLFWTAGALTAAMLLGVGLARNDLMHLRHLELNGSGEIAVDAELAALGLETQTTQSAQSQVDTPTAADLQNDLLHHTAFLAVAYILISLGSAVCLVEILEQWPNLKMLAFVRGRLQILERIAVLQRAAAEAALAAETIARNRLVLMRAAQDMIIRAHLDGLSYVPWWRNVFEMFHIADSAKFNKKQVYGLRWMRAVNLEAADKKEAACLEALKALKLVEPEPQPTEADHD